MKFCVLYFVQNAQIFYPVVTMYTVAVIHLLIKLKRLDESMSYQTMNQKRLATYVTGASVAESHFNVRFCAPSVFLRSQTHDAFWHPRLAAAFGATTTRQGLDSAKRAHLVSAFISLDVGPHFNTSNVALRLLHGYLPRSFLR